MSDEQRLDQLEARTSSPKRQLTSVLVDQVGQLLSLVATLLEANTAVLRHLLEEAAPKE